MSVAIIGGGISGLMAAEHLNGRADYTLFEASDRLGGHAHTQTVQVDGQQIAVDTGFIVFNEQNYPHFCSMLARHGVAYEDTEMSFAVTDKRTGLEYKASDLKGMFCQKRNLFNPKFYRMIHDIKRFYAEAPDLLLSGLDVSIGQYFEEAKYGRYFIDHHIMPMVSALWSGDFATIKAFPLMHMLHFMNNHDMLQINDRPQWKTITGGSQRYVEALVNGLQGQVHRSTPVLKVDRNQSGCLVTTADGVHFFDQVIFACHSDQALRLLSSPSDAEAFGLGYIPYTENQVDLHSDASLMPLNRKAWASWHVNQYPDVSDRCTVNYCMNILQNIDTQTPLIVSLNQRDQIDPDKVHFSTSYWHPVFDGNTMDAQQMLSQIQGRNRSYYCGAYMGWGFHEDGALSGVRAAQKLLTDVEKRQQAA